MFLVKNKYVFKDIDKTSKKNNVFYVLKNPDSGEFFSVKKGAVEDINEASKYKTVGILKAVIKKIFFPERSIVLRMVMDTNVFEKYELPKDSFDNFEIIEVLEIN